MPAIQWGIDNCTTYGGSVYVKAPTYTGTYNAAVTLKNRVTLVLEQGSAGITVTIDTGATATLLDYQNYDFKHWDSGVLVTFIEDRSQNEPYSYTVFRQGSFYYAKNGTTGGIDEQSTNASQIINNAVSATYDNGGGVVKITTNVTITSSIILKAGVTVEGQGRGDDPYGGINPSVATINSQINNGDPVIKTDSTPSQFISGCSIRFIRIVGSGQDGHGIQWIFAPKTWIQNVHVQNVSGSGFYIEHCWGMTLLNCHALHCGRDGFELVDRNHGLNLISCSTMVLTRYGISMNTTGQGAGSLIEVFGGFYQDAGANVTVWINNLRSGGFHGVSFEQGNNDAIISIGNSTLGSHMIEIDNCYFNGGGTTTYAIFIEYGLQIEIHACRFATITTGVHRENGHLINVHTNRWESVTNEVSGDYIVQNGLVQKNFGGATPGNIDRYYEGTVAFDTSNNATWVLANAVWHQFTMTS